MPSCKDDERESHSRLGLMTNKLNERPQWAREKQPHPPNFGQAKLVSKLMLQLEVWKRRSKTIDLIRDSRKYAEFEDGLVSMVVLSCKRLPEFKRLCESLVPFFSEVENYPKLEKILVDNGSGKELVNYAEGLNFFDTIIAHPENLGMPAALNDAYQRVRGEFIMLIEDDMVVDYHEPYIQKCLDVLAEYPEIGIVRLKNQNNWWKPGRVIAPIRDTSSEVAFWTWLPSKNMVLNVWAMGSTLFRKVSFMSTGLFPLSAGGLDQVVQIEEVYAREYNQTWLAAKVRNCYPVFQPNDNLESPGFEDKLQL